MTSTDANGNTLLYRIETLEKNFEKLQDRIEERLTLILTQMSKLNDKFVQSELEAQRRDSEQKQAISGVQLRLFYAILGLAGLFLVTMAAYYFTHTL